MSHVLIVDDNPDNLYFLEVLLRGHGFEVTSARHGAEALVLARQRPPDFVISDLLMPVMDGYTLLRHWKADDALRHIPFIVYTATYTEAEDERLAINLGADSFIVKPAEPDVILAAVDELRAKVAAAPTTPREPADDEKGLLEEYSEILIRKLEHKSLQLEAANAALRQEIEEREQARVEKQRLTQDLRERVKELRLLYEAARLLRDDDHLPAGDVIDQVANLLPGAMQHPELAAACITLGDIERATPGFQRSARHLDVEFVTDDEVHGRVRLVYLADVPGIAADEDPFLPEERQMVESLLEMLRVFAERRAAQSAARLLTEQLTIERGRLVSAQEIAKIGSWEADLVTMEVVWSEQTMRIFERDPVVFGLDHMAFLDLVHPEDRDAVLEEFSRSYKLVDPLQIDHRVVFPDGRLKYVTERWQVFHDDQGRATRALGTVQDITEWAEAENERVLAEESLRESEERYRTTAAQLSNVLDSSLDLICSFDIDGRFLRVNAACLAMLGYTVEEMLGSLYLSKVLPEDLAKTRAAAAAAIAGRSMRNFENRYQRKDGGICVIQWAAHWSADEETMFCVGRDVTEHKQLEAQFLRAQRMESIGTLAGGIAHDFNNILAPIMLSIELLKMDEHDPMHLDVLSTVERSSQRGADMVRQLLSFARGVERDQVQNQLGELIREVEKILTDTFLRTVAISVDVPDDLWPVQGDPTQLHQVLMNLVVNARDAMPNGGSLTVTARNVQLDGHEPTVQSDAAVGPYVVVSVSDTGTGMDERVLDRVFEPFFTTKEVGKGTGLGLSTSQAIVKSHGGFMEVTSRPGVGTTVSFSLPATPDPVPEAADDPSAKPPRGHGQPAPGGHDEAPLRQITRQMLEAFGYRVLLAADGADAIETYREHGRDIAVVLTDMMMPNTDGPALITELLRIDPEAKIVVASGVNTLTMVGEVRALGVDHWISKPYDAETLLTTLKELLPDP